MPYKPYKSAKEEAIDLIRLNAEKLQANVDALVERDAHQQVAENWQAVADELTKIIESAEGEE